MWAYCSPAQVTVAPLFQSIPPLEFFALIENNKSNPDFIILDVRTPAEFSQARIKNSILLDIRSKTFPINLMKLDKQKTYLLYCRSGNRSLKALEMMRQMNFMRVYNMTGGILKWYRLGLPIVTQ
ncbi:rhodanese-like domain-containing protein [bacterium]|nr:rhodanese-like domain-containing protein [bacterium]